MNVGQLIALTRLNTDISGVMQRFSGNEALYISCLSAFLEDNTMEELNTSITGNRWDDAFTAAHALKGLAGNMGFVPLMHSLSKLVILIRSARLSEISEAMDQINFCYNDITNTIRQNFICSGVNERGK